MAKALDILNKYVPASGSCGGGGGSLGGLGGGDGGGGGGGAGTMGGGLGGPWQSIELIPVHTP